MSFLFKKKETEAPGNSAHESKVIKNRSNTDRRRAQVATNAIIYEEAEEIDDQSSDEDVAIFADRPLPVETLLKAYKRKAK